jgi:hypothetical protein
MTAFLVELVQMKENRPGINFELKKLQWSSYPQKEILPFLWMKLCFACHFNNTKGKSC